MKQLTVSKNVHRLDHQAREHNDRARTAHASHTNDAQYAVVNVCW